MGGTHSKYTTSKYKIPFVLTSKEVSRIVAYGMETTGPVSKPDNKVIKELFPYLTRVTYKRNPPQLMYCWAMTTMAYILKRK